MFNDIKRVREHVLAVGPSFADSVEWNLTQVLASALGAMLVAFVAYLGAASAWAFVTAL